MYSIFLNCPRFRGQRGKSGDDPRSRKVDFPSGGIKKSSDQQPREELSPFIIIIIVTEKPYLFCESQFVFLFCGPK